MYHENIWDLQLKGWVSNPALPSASWVRMGNLLFSLRYNSFVWEHYCIHYRTAKVAEKKSRFSPETCRKSVAISLRNLWIRMGFLCKILQAFNGPWRWSLVRYFWEAQACRTHARGQLHCPIATCSFLLLDSSPLVLLSKGTLCLLICSAASRGHQSRNAIA